MSRNICMLAMSTYPADPRIRREAEALEAAGMKVDILCLRAEGEPATSTYGDVTAYRIMRERDKENLIAYLGLSVTFAAWSTVRLWGRSLKVRYDLIQAHSMPDFLVASGLLHRLRGRPLVLDLHDLSVELLGSKWDRRKSAILRPMVALGERASCAMATHLISTSPGFVERLVERGNDPEDITMVLNTADSRFQDDGSREFEVIDSGVKLIYHGTVATRFGLVLAIDALAAVREKIPGSTLTIHGAYDPGCRAEIEQKISDYGLEDAVHLEGWRPLEELVDILRAADIGIVPYMSDEFMNLALSTKTFEYAATGIPIVASRLNSTESIFDDESVRYFEPGNAQDMADQIIAACGDPDDRRERAKRASETLAPIRWDVMAKRYVDLVEDLTSSER